MTNEQKETVNKALPFNVKEGWTAMPNAIFTIYSMYPNFTPFDALIYAYLLKNHNAEYGYAYPTIETMAQDLDVSKKTVERSIKKLEELKLIRIKTNTIYRNNNYYFNKPIENISHFEREFPEVIEYRKKHKEKWETISEKSKADKFKYEQKRRSR